MADPIAQNFIGGVATNVTSNIFATIFQKLEDIYKLEENSEILETNFSTLQELLNDFRNQFEAQQKRLEEPLKKWLTKMEKALGEAEDLINRANRQRERAWYQRWGFLLWNLNHPSKVRAWQVTYNALIEELRTYLLLQPVPDSGFTGSGIRTAQDQLQTWLTDPHHRSRVIGVYGMGGVGKTSLLKVIYNTYKKQQQVGGIFDVVLWFTVSQSFDVLQIKLQIKLLQASVAKAAELDLEGTSEVEDRKMRLHASLRKSKKNFLIVLDDVRRPIDLRDVVGIGFGNDNPSKIIVSSRDKNIIARMGALEYSLDIRPLSTEEGWELFKSRAFTNGDVTGSNIEEGIAREIADACKGLPLAINVVAAAMRSRKRNDEWSRALTMMKNVDPAFPITHDTIHAERLYPRLEWSINNLPDPIKNCFFLCCALFPKHRDIRIEWLVETWRAHGLLGETSHVMDVGRQYIDVLVRKCLVEYSTDGSTELLRLHGLIWDVAIWIGQKE